MKILFLSLLLLNAGYLGYNLWNAQTDEGHGVSAESFDGATLKLVDEPPETARPQEQGVDGSAASAGEVGEKAMATERSGGGSDSAEDRISVAQCHVIGPVPGNGQLDRLRERARDEGLRVVDQWSEQTEMPRYWVHIPPADDMGAARETLRRLEEREVKDIQLISSGRMARGISLGLFSTRSAADRRDARIRVQGFDTEVNEVTVQAEGHWIAVRASSGEPVDESRLRTVTRDTEGAETTQRPCDAIESREATT